MPEIKTMQDFDKLIVEQRLYCTHCGKLVGRKCPKCGDNPVPEKHMKTYDDAVHGIVRS